MSDQVVSAGIARDEEREERVSMVGSGQETIGSPKEGEPAASNRQEEAVQEQEAGPISLERSVPQEERTPEGQGVAVAEPGESAVAPGDTPAIAVVPLDELRSLVLRAYPEALPELVQGKTLAELVASAEQAVALRERLLAQVPAAAPPVAAGAPRRVDIGDVSHLSPLEKLLRAIAHRGG